MPRALDYALATCLICLTSCRDHSAATVNDVSVPTSQSAGYRVVTVDGAPPKRASSSIITVVPYVLLDPGHHSLTVRSDSPDQTNTAEQTLEIDVLRGQRYNLVFRNGHPVLIPNET